MLSKFDIFNKLVKSFSTETGVKQPAIRKTLSSQFKHHTSNSKQTFGLGVQYMFSELEQTPWILASHVSNETKSLNSEQIALGVQYKV